MIESELDKTEAQKNESNPKHSQLNVQKTESSTEAAELWAAKQQQGEAKRKLLLVVFSILGAIGLALIVWGLWVVALN